MKKCQHVLVEKTTISYLVVTQDAGLSGSVGCGLTGDQEVAGSSPAGLATFLWILIVKYFLWSFSLFSPFC